MRIRPGFLLSSVLIVACSGGHQDTDAASTSGGASTGEATTGGSSDTGAPTDTGLAPTATCGDGVLDPDELCDPPGGACDATCAYVDRALWTVTRGGPDTPAMPFDVAVDPAGGIVAFGYGLYPDGDGWSSSMWLLGLDAAGAQRFETKIPPLFDYFYQPHVATDGSAIYFHDIGVHRLGPAGEPGWDEAPVDAGLAALTLADGAVYVGGAVFGEYDSDHGRQHTTLLVQRRDAATGAVVWDSRLADATIDTVATALAVIDGTVHVVGRWAPLDTPGGGSVRLTIDAATGVAGPTSVEDAPESPSALVALPSGDLAVGGQSAEGPFVRRVDPAGAARWTTLLEPDFALVDLAVGPDGLLVAVGTHFDAAVPHGFVHAVSDVGARVWSAGFAPIEPGGGTFAVAAAFGPDFLVVEGNDADGPSGDTTWIRRIALD